MPRSVLSCSAVQRPWLNDDQYQMMCGTRSEVGEVVKEYNKVCPFCL